jgi:hypothetical protein
VVPTNRPFLGLDAEKAVEEFQSGTTHIFPFTTISVTRGSMQNADGLLWFLTLEARLSERDKLFISDT